MADQHSSNELAPSLQAVLSSLSVNLEAELNRYRRNRSVDTTSAFNSSSDDVFASIEDSAFDIDPIAAVKAAPTTTSTLAISAAPGTPPPLPPNKKLLDSPVNKGIEAPPSADNGAGSTAQANPTAGSFNANSFNTSGFNSSTQPHLQPAAAYLANGAANADGQESIKPDSAFNNAPDNRVAGLSFATPGIASPITGLNNGVSSAGPNPAVASALSISTAAATDSSPQMPASGYLASSEKLIESLNEVPSMPEPVDTTFKPKRKTVSLFAGATLGLLGLIAGLGASYLMSNPMVAQRLATGFGNSEEALTAASPEIFAPPGPNLSAQEFVDIDIDNLSSLNMPQTGLDPLASPTGPNSPTPLPPIANPAQVAQGQSNSPVAGLPTETQAAVIPAGGNFYVTVPFTTEQALSDVRQAVDEAFVRQFSDGNRVQLAVFDNADTAQQFIAELQDKGVSAQIYGPTTE